MIEVFDDGVYSPGRQRTSPEVQTSKQHAVSALPECTLYCTACNQRFHLDQIDRRTSQRPKQVKFNADFLLPDSPTRSERQTKTMAHGGHSFTPESATVHGTVATNPACTIVHSTATRQHISYLEANRALTTALWVCLDPVPKVLARSPQMLRHIECYVRYQK